ncbi:MAG: permease-like cell division protein FtsX [Betaproteobacteria bacterium]|nr:permease-like cell division protein FtsX [Betaproteobacteria bacterium]
MRAWIHQHGSALRLALRQLGRHPFANLLAILVIAFALGLPAGLYRLVNTASALSHNSLHEPRLTLFMAADADASAVRAVWDALASYREVREFRYISNTDALAELKANPALTDAVNALNRNPLPHTFVVRARDPSPAGLESLRLKIASWNKVERVQMDGEWAKRLAALLEFVRHSTNGLAATLAIALIFIVFNTVRQQVLAAREEIEVTHLIGATSRYIRRPFLYFGLIQGLLGATIAILLLLLGTTLFNKEVLPLSALFGLDLHLPLPAVAECALLGLVAVVLSWGAAFLSVFLTLKRIR